MKYLFFLIIFLLPIGLAYGESGKNFDRVANNDGTFTWTSHPERILDNGQWLDYITTNNVNDITVETSYGSIKLDRTTCEFSFYGSGKIGGKTPILIDTITAIKATNGTENWTGVNQINNAVCQTSVSGSTLTAIKIDTVGIMNYKYSFTGSSWKTELKVTNLSVASNQKFGFNQTFILNSDTINFGGSLKNLDDFNNQNFDRTFLANNEAKVIDLLNGNKFDFDLGFNQLESISIKDLGIAKTQLDFTYTHNANIILPNQTIIIDPSFSGTPNSFYGGILSTAVNCNAGAESAPTSGVTAGWTKWSSGSANGCQISVFDTDVSSLPDNLIVSNSSFSATTNSVTSPDGNTDITWFPIIPFGATTGIQMMRAVELGTILVSTVKWSTCAPCLNEDVDLGATADANIQASIFAGNNTVGLGWIDSVRARDGTTRQIVLTSATLRLGITYAVPLSAPTNFNTTVIAYNTIDLNWTKPVECDISQTCTGYKIWRESPIGAGFSQLIENTSNTNVYYRDTTGLFGTVYNYRLAGYVHDGIGLNSSNVANTTLRVAPITTLAISDERPTAIDIGWSAPVLNGETVLGYQINKTTPWSPNVATVVVNNTSTIATAYTISNLTGSTQYSFEVGTWTTVGDYNGTGNYVNGTTDFDPTTTFTVGTFDITQVNTDVIDIRFERQDLDPTSIYLNVTYLDTYNLACDFEYKLSGINRTYSNFANVTIDSDHVESYFWFQNITNDIIDVDCWDQLHPENSGRYLIERYDTNSSFPLIVQFEQFRDGTFGTAGMFGFFDMITLAVIILSMIGFNRVNPAVGAIFCTVVILFLGYFEIITTPTIIFSALALVLMLAVASTRSDQG